MSVSITVGIAGGTGAGKTTLARRLAETLGDAVVLDMDSYYLDRSGMSAEARARVNFDEPDAIDMSLLVEHLRLLRAGQPIEKPRYSFETHERIGVEPVTPAAVVLVEGLLALWWDDLRSAFDLKIYLDAPDEVRLGRRVRRDGGACDYTEGVAGRRPSVEPAPWPDSGHRDVGPGAARTRLLCVR